VKARSFLSLGLALLAAIGAALVPGAGANAQQCGAGKNGSPGYAYAGHQSASVGHGVRATITATRAPFVSSGHVAGWIGVGGPNGGPNGEAQWLQVGIASVPQTPTMLYVEITRAGKSPTFIPILDDVQVDESHRLAVLEVSRRPNWWKVWVDGQPVTQPLFLPGSANRWQPIATAESFNGGRAVCNSFAFRFERVGVAGAMGGSWRHFRPGFRFLDAGYKLRQLSKEPKPGTRLLATGGPEPFAFASASES
jgi:hypothetical protein